MPDVQVVGDVGAVLDNTATFTVADIGLITEFTKVRELLHLAYLSYIILGITHGRILYVEYQCGELDWYLSSFPFF
jgi:hypothetical protein